MPEFECAAEGAPMIIERELRAVVADDAIVTGDRVDPRYFGDWIHRIDDVRPAALALPRSTAEVAAILRVCDARRVAVTTQGGRTGLAGGATPQNDCVILSLERLRSIQPVDPAAATLVVESGVVLETVQRAADSAGLLFPLDIGSRGTCTIGGNLSTNAGGNRVLRYGMMRELVLGLEAVLADGTVLTSMNSMQKNNTGYDLKQLFIGSEGTLGVITRAVLRLFPQPTTVQTALCAVGGHADMVRLLAAAKGELGATLAAFEVMWPDFYTLGTTGIGVRGPLAPGYGAYVLVESMGFSARHDTARFQEFIESLFTQGVIQDAAVAQSLKESREMWRIRDSSGDFRKTFWPYVGFDISIPIGDMERFMDECRSRLTARWPDIRTLWFGHAADSNLHIAVRLDGVDPLPEADIDTIVYDCVGEHAGSISAEHGIGLLKRDYLAKSRTADEIAVMRTLKRSLDPHGTLNPGKIFR